MARYSSGGQNGDRQPVGWWSQSFFFRQAICDLVTSIEAHYAGLYIIWDGNKLGEDSFCTLQFSGFANHPFLYSKEGHHLNTDYDTGAIDKSTVRFATTISASILFFFLTIVLCSLTKIAFSGPISADNYWDFLNCRLCSSLKFW